MCISNDNRYAFSASKDCSIIKCEFLKRDFSRKKNARSKLIILGCLSTGKKLHLIRRIAKSDDTNERSAIVGHFDHILAIAISTDGQFLVNKVFREII